MIDAGGEDGESKGQEAYHCCFFLVRLQKMKEAKMQKSLQKGKNHEVGKNYYRNNIVAAIPINILFFETT